MKVIADYDICEGHGLCAQQAPEVFELNEDGELVHHFDGAELPVSLRDAVSSAVSACPAQALRLES